MNKLGDSRPPARLSWRLTGVAILLLAACQSPDVVGQPAPADGWRVVERTGDARTGNASTGRLDPVEVGAILGGGMLAATGPASRLILARRQDQISLGPTARLVLPEDRDGDVLEQQAGVVRYRIRADRSRPLQIAAPTARGESTSGSFEIGIASDLGRTSFAVVEGALRITTTDGTRGVTIGGGQSAQASTTGDDRLAFRRGAGRPLEPIAPMLLPAEGLGVAPAAPRVHHAEVRTGTPSTGSGARSMLHAAAAGRGGSPLRRAVASAAKAAAAIELVAEAVTVAEPPAKALPVPEPMQAEPPEERIILPATYSSRQSGPAAAPPRPVLRPETHDERGAAPPAGPFDLLVDGLLDGLDRDTPVRVRPVPR